MISLQIFLLWSTSRQFYDFIRLSEAGSRPATFCDDIIGWSWCISAGICMLAWGSIVVFQPDANIFLLVCHVHNVIWPQCTHLQSNVTKLISIIDLNPIEHLWVVDETGDLHCGRTCQYRSKCLRNVWSTVMSCLISQYFSRKMGSVIYWSSNKYTTWGNNSLFTSNKLKSIFGVTTFILQHTQSSLGQLSC